MANGVNGINGLLAQLHVGVEQEAEAGLAQGRDHSTEVQVAQGNHTIHTGYHTRCATRKDAQV